MDYEYWCSLSNEELAAKDAAFVNLVAAADLPGTESINFSAVLRRLDEWTKSVAHQTDYWRPSFVPQDYCRTEAEFCMMAMITHIQRDLGVTYNPDRMTGHDNCLDARDSFIHGPLTGHGGTCSSLPILYLAIGQRLGYPVHLVCTVRHLFLRWDGGGERFNIECAGRGFGRYEDEHYCSWPVQMTAAERQCGLFLSNFTPRRTLAAFIYERGHCLLDNLRLDEALYAYKHASQLEPAYTPQWAQATMMDKIMRNLHSKRLSISFPFHTAIDYASQISVEPYQQRMLEVARLDLHRIVDLHDARQRDTFEDMILRGQFHFQRHKGSPHVRSVDRPLLQRGSDSDGIR